MLRLRAVFVSIVALVIATTVCASAAEPEPPSADALRAELAELRTGLAALHDNPKISPDLWADAQIFAKAARWAIEFEPELDANKRLLVERGLRRGRERLKLLQAGQHPWAARRGRAVRRGFVSAVDGSTQPFGLIVPAGYDSAKPMRLDVVLHGSTGATGMGDLAFLNRLDGGDEPAQPAPDVSFIELQPMGRLGENAYRFEGETDVYEAIEAVCRQFNVDRSRIVLRGSSLGGVGEWQMGLKRPDRFVAVGPAAGPVDTIEFAASKWPHFVPLDPLTPWQKTLLHEVDAIDYTANAGMVPIVAAMGDQDHYFPSHLLIAKAFEKEGIPFVGLVDRGAGHGITPKVMQEQLRLLGERATKGLDPKPENVRFVTWTLKFSRCYWIEILGLEKHYARAEIDARLAKDGSITVAEPKNITRFAILPLADLVVGATLTIGGKRVDVPRQESAAARSLVIERHGDAWQCAGNTSDVKLTGKRPGLQGPIDDAFATPFLCVLGTGKAWNPAVGEWADASLKRFAYEWQHNYRGDLPLKNDTEVTAEDLHNKNLILFGDPGSNHWIADALAKLPIEWTREKIRIGKQSYPAAEHTPQLIAPNPLPGATGHYLVINSGHTYHADALRFSYMVYPRLGDWAIAKVGENPASAAAPAVAETVLDSGICEEDWSIR